MAVEISFPIGIVHRRLGPGVILAEALFFPELSRLAGTREHAASLLKRNLAEWIPKFDNAELIRRRRAMTARIMNFTLDVAPPKPTKVWSEMATLTFHAVVWEHGDSFVLARIPALGIEVIAAPKDDLTAVLRRECLAALRRNELSTKLQSLAGTQTTTAVAVEWISLPVKLPSLRERVAREDNEHQAPKKSVLRTVARALAGTDVAPAYEIEEVVSQIAEALAAKPAQSVLLVGPSGVGKTAAFRELARRRGELHLRDTPFYGTSGSRLVAGQSGFGMWEERCQELIRAAAKERAVLHLGNLVELLDVGKSECNPTGIAAFLRPAIARGDLLCVAECTPEQLPLLEKEDPQLLDAFRTITLDEPDTMRGRRILEKFAAADRRREPSAAGLAAIDRLHRRYATYSAYPGRPLRFLDNLRRDGRPRTVIDEPEVYAAFARETGLPAALIDPAAPLDVAATRAWFSARVIGQPEAVNLIVELLATVKAGLARPNRPVASLLFIGPTGVGKTELAKALAEFLFGSRDRLTRFDMSEYGDAIAVRRLVGGAFGTEGLLTAKVREEPFCVLLLDEVEKAHASFFDLLLQALGEARLTDAGGRLADFRNAVIILTSNLGTESYRAGRIGLGGGSNTDDAASHFTAAVEKALRPEMFNRLDRVVPFAPLGPQVIRQIAAREWQKVLLREGVRFRGATVTAGEELLDHLAVVGFDPRYGARPLKRTLERGLLAPLARQMNRHAGDLPVQVRVDVTAGQFDVHVRPEQGSRARPEREPTSKSGQLAVAAQDLRRWHQLLERSSVVRELENDVTQLALVEKSLFRRQAKGRSLTGEDQKLLAKLGRLRELAGEVRRQRTNANDFEDMAVAAFYDGVDPLPALAGRRSAADADWEALLIRLYALSAPTADALVLALFAEDRNALANLAEVYRLHALRHECRVAVALYALVHIDEPRPQSPPPKTTQSDEPYWHEDRLMVRSTGPPVAFYRRLAHPAERSIGDLGGNVLGLALSIRGPATQLRFGGEAGLHRFVRLLPVPAADVMVFVTAESLNEFRPLPEWRRKGAFDQSPARRNYNLPQGTITDPEIDENWTGMPVDLRAALDPVLAANLRHRLMQMILE